MREDLRGMQEYSQPPDRRAEHALDHPTRRAILDLLAGEEGLGPGSIAEKLGVPVANAGYHVDVLTVYGAVEPASDKRHGERLVRLPRSASASRKNRLDVSDSRRDNVSEAQLKSLIEMAAHLRPRHAPGAGGL